MSKIGVMLRSAADDPPFDSRQLRNRAMASDPANEPREPQIHVDEDWKERVKAEAAALDRESSSPERPRQEQSREDSPTTKRTPPADVEAQAQQLPPAEFATIISVFSTQALVALGVLPNPATGKPEAELVLARHFIDLLDVLFDKTKGNLAAWEHSALESTLHELRMLYIEKTRSA